MDEEKKFGEVVERTEAFLDYKNIDLQKSQNLNFSKRDSPWVLLKNADFSILCFNAHHHALCFLEGNKPRTTVS